ncbi:MAG: rod shape-determining protein MreD [Gammaproteobacteria bacterium]|nr:rod shape-determining protein MreD [Gammaproteobacteria bacterium]NNC78201.1 rod shape-determining protein MreD [Woeseiaceae bacterium]
MSNGRAMQHLPVVLSMIVALALTMMPLPYVLDVARPDWIALIIIFWSLSVPRSYGVGIAWIAGLVLDVSQGTLLGQHALALAVVAYLTVRFHLQMRVFPLLQLTAFVFALNALYQFLLFWVNGVAGITAPSSVYWAPVLVGAFIWPLLYSFLSGLRYRVQTGS